MMRMFFKSAHVANVSWSLAGAVAACVICNHHSQLDALREIIAAKHESVETMLQAHTVTLDKDIDVLREDVKKIQKELGSGITGSPTIFRT